MNTALTVILTIRGRSEHTIRWLWYANKIRLPYHIIIADGDVTDEIKNSIGLFKDISIEYIEFVDTNFSDFYQKCLKSINLAKTPYVIFSDNDDFIVTSGVEKCVSFLNKNQEYVSAGGSIPSFYLHGKLTDSNLVTGSLKKIWFGYTTATIPLSHSDPADRVRSQLSSYQVTHYNVFRTQVLRKIYSEICSFNFSDLVVHEFYAALRSASLGKIHMHENCINYIRQKGTTQGFSAKVDWVHQLLRSNLPSDYRIFANKIASEVYQNIEPSTTELMEEILIAYASYLRTMLAHNLMRYRFPFFYKIKMLIKECILKFPLSIPFYSKINSLYFFKSYFLREQGKEIQNIFTQISSNELKELIKIIFKK